MAVVITAFQSRQQPAIGVTCVSLQVQIWGRGKCTEWWMSFRSYPELPAQGLASVHHGQNHVLVTLWRLLILK